MDNGEVLFKCLLNEDIDMRNLFNIKNKADIDSFLDIYISHLENDLHLPQKYLNKTKEKMAKLLAGDKTYAEVLHHLNSTACDKCGSSLNEIGFCDSEQCIYNDWPQSTRWSDNNISWTPIFQDAHLKRVRILASASSDDHVIEVNSFDVAPYFNTLSDLALINFVKNLSNEEWGYGEYSDEMALYFSDYSGDIRDNKMVAEIFEHNSNLPSHKEERGFGCALDNNGEDILNWVKQNRTSDVFNKVQSIIED